MQKPLRIQKCDGPTDGPTNERTDGHTEGWTNPPTWQGVESCVHDKKFGLVFNLFFKTFLNGIWPWKMPYIWPNQVNLTSFFHDFTQHVSTEKKNTFWHQFWRKKTTVIQKKRLKFHKKAKMTLKMVILGHFDLISQQNIQFLVQM